MIGAHRRLVGDAYDRAAPTLRRSAGPLVYRALARPLIDAVVDAVGPQPGPVLDVAAGAGAFGHAFEETVAVDISTGQLRANPAGRRLRAEAERLPFPADAFAAAGCSFGINHFAHPAEAVREMARVAPVVALSTWSRPQATYGPKRIVEVALERHAGTCRSPIGHMLDELSERVGSVAAVTELLVEANLEPQVGQVEVEVPWAGADAFLEYRLARPTTPATVNRAALRDEVAGAIAALRPDELVWRPRLVIGVGRRG